MHDAECILPRPGRLDVDLRMALLRLLVQLLATRVDHFCVSKDRVCATGSTGRKIELEEGRGEVHVGVDVGIKAGTGLGRAHAIGKRAAMDYS